jgi:hypothetical protein
VAIISEVFEILAMLSVRTFNQEFYTRIFTLYTLTKDETMNFHTGTSYVLAASMLHVAAVTLLKVVCDYCKQKKVNLP